MRMMIVCIVWVWALVLLPASHCAAPELYPGFTLVDPQKETRTAKAADPALDMRNVWQAARVVAGGGPCPFDDLIALAEGLAR